MVGPVTSLVYEGRVFRIEFYVATSGVCSVREWLETLPQGLQHKLAALIVWLGDQGKIWNERKFKHLEGSDQIFEFKADAGRVLCFFVQGRRVILTNGLLKAGARTPRAEIAKAERIKREFQVRT